MKAPTLIRAASVLSLLQGIAHTLLFLRAANPKRPGDIDVVGAMRAYEFQVQGLSRSYWDFYFGYGLMSAFVVFFQVVLLWILAASAEESPRVVRAAILAVIVYNLGHASLALRYFFYTPIVPDVLIVLLLTAVVWRSRAAAA